MAGVVDRPPPDHDLINGHSANHGHGHGNGDGHRTVANHGDGHSSTFKMLIHQLVEKHEECEKELATLRERLNEAGIENARLRRHRGNGARRNGNSNGENGLTGITGFDRQTSAMSNASIVSASQLNGEELPGMVKISASEINSPQKLNGNGAGDGPEGKRDPISDSQDLKAVSPTGDPPFQPLPPLGPPPLDHAMSLGRRPSDATFVMRVVWTAELPEKPVRGSQVLATPNGTVEESHTQTTKQTYNGFMRHLICWPGNPYRVAWDLVGAVLIFFDLIAIPLQAYDPPENMFSFLMDWFTLVFWTTNMLLEPFTGYVKNGVTVVHPASILWNYVRGWFIIDLVAVVPDWVFSIASLNGGGSSSAGDSVRLVRILRLVRMVRLLRLLKLRKVTQSLSDMIDSEYISILVNIAKMILALLMINHIIACIWFQIGKGSTDNSWLSAAQLDQVHWTYQYTTSFHWSLTQFTPASMDIQPRNMEERVFAVTVVVFALVGFSYLVGSITGSLTQLRSMQEDASKQFWSLRRYLKQNQVPPILSLRIQKYLEHAWQRQAQTLSMGDIKIFKLLSEQLCDELKSALSLPHLSVHPLFKYLNTVSNITIHRLANRAISMKLVAGNDSVFYVEETATHMYVVVTGKLRYLRHDDAGDHNEWVDKNEDWISEPVLWTPTWVHLGQLTAVMESELLMLEYRMFGEVMTLNPQAFHLAVTYASNFLKWLCTVDIGDLSDISQGEDVSDMARAFLGMETDEDELMGMSASMVPRACFATAKS